MVVGGKEGSVLVVGLACGQGLDCRSVVPLPTRQP